MGADPFWQQVCARLDELQAEASVGEVLLCRLLVEHL